LLIIEQKSVQKLKPFTFSLLLANHLFPPWSSWNVNQWTYYVISHREICLTNHIKQKIVAICRRTTRRLVSPRSVLVCVLRLSKQTTIIPLNSKLQAGLCAGDVVRYELYYLVYIKLYISIR
jgi:hypothetical protein